MLNKGYPMSYITKMSYDIVSSPTVKLSLNKQQRYFNVYSNNNIHKYSFKQDFLQLS